MKVVMRWNDWATRWGPQVLKGVLGCCLATPAAGLDLATAQALAEARAPGVAMRAAELRAAQALVTAAGELPDPSLSVGLEALPISGPMRFRTTAEPMTQRTLGWMQAVPNAARRAAQRQMAQARSGRDAALLTAERLAVRREVAQAWLARWYAERRLERFAALEHENRLLRQTVNARLTAGTAMPADATMAEQEALMLADRRDELERERAQAQATLLRWLGDDAQRALVGPPPPLRTAPAAVLEEVDRHADLQAYAPMLQMTQAEVAESEAMKRGDWSWQVMYSQRASAFGDLIGVQFSFDLPLWPTRRQDPQIDARRQEATRLQAEREERQRERREALSLQLAEIDEATRQLQRLRTQAAPLAEQRVALALAAYEAARGGLAEVLTARRERAELTLRELDLQARQQRLHAGLNDWIEENR